MRRIAGAFAALLIAGTAVLVPFTGMTAGAATLTGEEQSAMSGAESRKDRLEEERKKTRETLEKLNGLKEDTAAYITELDKSLMEVGEELDGLNRKIRDKELEIGAAEVQLSIAEKDEERQHDDMKLRIKYMYEQKSAGGMAEVVFSSHSLADLMNRSEYIRKITEYDRKRLDDYAEAKRNVEEQKAKLEKERNDLEELKTDAEARQESMELLMADKKDELTKYTDQISEAEEDLDEFDEEIAGEEAAIRELEDILLQREAEERAREEARRAAEAASRAEEESRRAAEAARAAEESRLAAEAAAAAAAAAAEESAAASGEGQMYPGMPVEGPGGPGAPVSPDGAAGPVSPGETVGGAQGPAATDPGTAAATAAALPAAETSGSSEGSSSSSSSGSVDLIWPCPSSSRITSYFGSRSAPTKGASTNHKGIDIGAPTGTEIIAAAGGEVVTATYSSSAGNYIMISHGNSMYTVYMHCSSLSVSEGDQVKQGQVIGKVGSTGYSTGPHLHFGVRYDGEYRNPLNYVSP